MCLAQAAPQLPEGLSDEEIYTLRVLGVFDAPLQRWKRQLTFANAVEEFARAGLIARCPRIRAFKADDYYFDPQLRAALDSVVDAHYVGGIFPLTLASFRFHIRNALWAMESLSSDDKAALWNYINTPTGRKILQRYYAVHAIQVYQLMTPDACTGVHLAAIPIAFKAYFRDSGQLDDIENAMRKVAPSLLIEFDQIKPLDQYSADQKTWLANVSADILAASDALQTAFIQELSEQERAGLVELLHHSFFQLLTQATSVRDDSLASALLRAISQSTMDNRLTLSGTNVADRSDVELLKRIATRFPEPPEVHTANLTMRPADRVANAHIAFCN